MRFLTKKIKKLRLLQKLDNKMMKDCFFEEKSFDFFESLLYQKGKAQNMPVIAGRLVYIVLQTKSNQPKLYQKLMKNMYLYNLALSNQSNPKKSKTFVKKIGTVIR